MWSMEETKWLGLSCVLFICTDIYVVVIAFIAAIATVEKELIQCKNSNAEPILEEFIPLKKSSTDEKDEKIEGAKEKDIINRREKMNWMSSVQLWNSDNQRHHLNTDDFSNYKLSTAKLDSTKKVTKMAKYCYFYAGFC